MARTIRAFDPEPGAWTSLGDSEIKLFGARVVNGSGTPGTVLEAGKTLQVAAAVGAVEVAEVQPAGKRRMAVGAWSRGRSVTPGQQFG